MSVLRRSREGVDEMGSSREKRELLVVGDIAFAAESPVSRRLGVGRPAPGDELNVFKWFCEWEKDAFRPATPPLGFSLEMLVGGGFKGELTDTENNCT